LCNGVVGPPNMNTTPAQLDDQGFRQQFWHMETRPYVRKAAMWRHFERGPLRYPLETDCLAEAGGFEPLHFRIGIREDSQPGAADSPPKAP
jgi:hypothetical protein